jgi:two-component system cell cycle sensor histidine kinase/response regulator CckA
MAADKQMSHLQIIHLADSDYDSELVQAELGTGGIDTNIVRVDTEEAFEREIEASAIDIILADRNCHGYNGLSAFSAARRKRPEVPFIFVSGTLDHRHAIESLTAGVTDFVFKQYLPQIVPAVRRVVREARTRSELQSARQNLGQQADLLDRANDGIILCDAQGVITYWNQGAQRIYGWSKKEAMGQNVQKLLQTTFCDAAPPRDQQSDWEGELRQVRRDGTPIFVASRWTLKADMPESPRLQINTDITARKTAQNALRMSEKRYRQFVEQDLTGNLIMRPDGQILTCNPAFARIFGFDSVDEAQSANFMSLLHSRKEGRELFELVRQHETLETHELELRQRHGDPVYVVARFIGSFDEQGQLTELQGYLFNDTKRKRLEQQLMQAQKMEGLGTLAGGIAHDFNNILAIILGYTTRLEKWRDDPGQIPGALKVIKEAVERGAALVQQLLTSARQTEARLSSLDLNDLIRELEKMLQATLSKMIAFDLRLDPILPHITADRSQIHQVLLNLCVNARDAMPDGGTITLETSIASGSQVSEYFTDAEAEQYACVRVRDTGTGMSRQVKSHIFEPFYTTKERGKGTGLGLSVVYGVVNNHHGFVQVDSELGGGTTFTIYLPVQHAVENISGNGAEQFGQRTSTARTILLVEDEEMLRELGVTILEGEGYHVLAAKDGMEAVEMFEANCDSIGLVVCDLGLPRLGGRDAFMKMKEYKPNVRAIVASGYLEPNVRSEMLKAGVIDTMQKPYDFRVMLEKIRSIIGEVQTEDDQPRLF